MIDLIVVGCGTHSLAHITCFAKIKDVFAINLVGVVDINQKRLTAFKHLSNNLGFATQDTLFKNDLSEISKELDISNSIVDIITPNNCHYTCAKEATDLGVKNIIIEKPLAHNLSDAMNIEKLDSKIAVIENYLFSSITQYIKKYIEEHKLKIVFVKTEFSKDRRVESLEGRGIYGDYIPNAFTIEIPHQVAIVSYLLGFPEDVCDAWSSDMILPERRIPDLGEGALTLVHNGGVASYNFTCLEGHRHLSTTYRTIRVYCEGGVNILGYYPTTSDLEGSVLVYRDQEIVTNHKLIADSMTETLKYLIECFMENKSPITDVSFGRRIVEIIDRGISLEKKAY